MNRKKIILSLRFTAKRLLWLLSDKGPLFFHMRELEVGNPLQSKPNQLRMPDRAFLFPLQEEALAS